MAKDWTTIKLSRTFKSVLDTHGNKNESYEDIIKKLIKKRIKLPKFKRI